MRYSSDARALIRLSAGQARQLGHSYVGSVHLLLALWGSGAAGNILAFGGMDPELIR